MFGHSMGSFLVMEVVRQLKLEHRDDIIRKLNIMLASPDIDVDVFRSQLKEIGRLPTPITMFSSKVDLALEISSLLRGGRPRAGQLDINDPAIRKAALDYGVRIVDIGALNDTAGGGHDRFATLAQFGGPLEAYDRNRSSSVARVGAFVFAAPGAAVTGPARVTLTAVRSR